MYILFINSVGSILLITKLDSLSTQVTSGIYIFSNQFNKNRGKKKKLSNPWVQTQPNPHGLGWIFLTHHSRLDRKIISTQPNLTHAHRSLLRQIPTNTLDMEGRSPLCIKHLLLARSVMLGPSVALWSWSFPSNWFLLGSYAYPLH